ncbi:hypothetical protein D3C75_1235280 [compost metagenome]
MIDHTVCEITALGEHTAFGGGNRFSLSWEVFVFRPTLSVNIDGVGTAVAVTLRWVGDVSTHSLIPESFFILKATTSPGKLRLHGDNLDRKG